jgi:SAM-dependent methyltransferase
MEKNEYKRMYTTENTYWWYRGLHGLVELFLKRLAKNGTNPPVILDAGCGTGRMMEIARNYGAIEGFDFSEEALNFCAMRGLDTVSRQDLSTWQPPSGKFDCITSLDVLYHRGVGDEDKLYPKFSAALKSGGLLVLNLPAFAILRRNHDDAVHTRKRFTKKETVRKLQDAGFRTVCATYRLPYLFFFILVKKAIERMAPTSEIHSDLDLLPVWLNESLLFLHRLENSIIFSGFPIPFGSSLFIVARKK